MFLSPKLAIVCLVGAMFSEITLEKLRLRFCHREALKVLKLFCKQEGTSLALKKHLEEEARDLSGEAFSRFMDQLYDRISALLDSSDVAENLGALRAIDELIDVALGENSSKVSKFANYIRTAFEVKRDPDILVLASRVLGHLARAGGAMTAEEVECQVCLLPFTSLT